MVGTKAEAIYEASIFDSLSFCARYVFRYDGEAREFDKLLDVYIKAGLRVIDVKGAMTTKGKLAVIEACEKHMHTVEV